MKKILFALLFVFLVSAVSALAVTTIGEVTMNGLASSVAQFDPGTTVTIKIPVTVDNSGGSAPTNTIAITSTNPLFPAQTLGPVTIGPFAVAPAVTQDVVFTLTVPADQQGLKSATAKATEAGQSDVTKAYRFTINEKPAVTVTPSSLTTQVQPGKTSAQTLTIKNTGNVVLSNLVLTHDRTEIKDSKDHHITVSFNPSSVASLAVGATATVTVNVQADTKYAIKTENDKVFVNAVSASGITPLPQVSIPLSVEVRPLACKAGTKGKVDIDIIHPRANDNVEAGTVLPVEVKVSNNNEDNDLDFTVEASFYNVNGNKQVDSFDTASNIRKNKDKTFKFNLQVPSDADKGDNYRIYIKASEDGNEDNNCIQESVSIDIKQLVNKVVVDSFTISPDTPACNAEVFGTVHVTNRDQDTQDVILTIRSDELSVLKQLPKITLEKAFRSGSEAFPQFSFKIPQNARAGTYLLNVIANYNGGASTWQRSVTVRECVQQSQPPQQPAQQTPQPANQQPVSGSQQVNIPSASNTGTPQPGVSTTIMTGKSTLESLDHVPLSVWLLANIVLVLAIVTLALIAFRRR